MGRCRVAVSFPIGPDKSMARPEAVRDSLGKKVDACSIDSTRNYRCD